jgi:hypothetical protein
MDPFIFFTVDTCVLRCYKPQKDKLFGGESPNELQKQSRVRPQPCLAGQAAEPQRVLSCNTPPTPGGENEAVFTSFLFLAPASALPLFQNETWTFGGPDLGYLPASTHWIWRSPCVTPALG